jgi:hypothetical protein
VARRPADFLFIPLYSPRYIAINASSSTLLMSQPLSWPTGISTNFSSETG